MKKPRLQLLGLPRCKRNHIRPAQIKRKTELWLYFPNFGSSVTRTHFLPTWLNKPVSFPSFLSTQRSKWEKDFPLCDIYSHCESPQSVPSVHLGRETADEEGVGDFENYGASNLILSVAPPKLERCDLQNILDKSNSQHFFSLEVAGFFLKFC